MLNLVSDNNIKIYGYQSDGKVPSEVLSLLNQNTVSLFHGSRGGIIPPIKPISRERCDFGKGFYMGNSEIQPKGLIAGDQAPYFYSLSLDIKFLRSVNAKIIYLSGEGWLNTVLSYRDKIPVFSALEHTHDLKRELDDCDLIIGRIADDRMNTAFRRFENYGLTDIGLKACLEYVNYGYQFVAKSQLACDCIDIVSERELPDDEIDFVNDYTVNQRKKSMDIVNEMAIKYQREGRYLNEIISELKTKPYEGISLL